MSKRRYVLLAFGGAAILAAGGLLLWGWAEPRRAMTVEINGEPGRRVGGRFKVDGVPHQLSVALPAKFVFQARGLSYAIAPTDGSADQQIAVTTSVAGMPAFFCSARGVKGWIVLRGAPWARGGGIAGMPPAELVQLQQVAQRVRRAGDE